MSVHQCFPGGGAVLNSNASYSVQSDYRPYVDVLHCDYRALAPKPYVNVREQIPHPIGNERTNWPHGAGYGWTRTLGYASPAAYQLPFNPRTRIPYWDKHAPYDAQSPFARADAPFLTIKGQRPRY